MFSPGGRKENSENFLTNLSQALQDEEMGDTEQVGDR